MGNTHKIDHSEEESTASEIMKQKREIQFRQNDFIRQIEGEITLEYEILSPYLKQNEFYELRKAIHIPTKLIRSVYIINKYKIRSSERELLEDQIHRLKSVDHPNATKIYELFKDSHRFYIVMELCYGESLASLLERERCVSEQRAAQIMWQMLNVIGHCHRKGIIHTDIKIENILFNSESQEILKIVDFSISRIFRIEDIIEQSKSKIFLSSPEALSGSTFDKSDIWQCGMLLYVLLCGEPAVIGAKKSKLSKRLLFFVPSFAEKGFKNVSKEAKSLIRSMLKLNPNERLSAQQCLENPWFRKFYRPPSVSTLNLKRCLMESFHFNPSSKLQEATWTFFVNALVPFSEKQNILNVFNFLDKKGRGQLSYEEVYEGLIQIYECEDQANFFAESIFRRLNRDKILFSHFVTVATNRIFLIIESNIVKIFNIIDEDGSGEISVNELRDILGSSKEVTEEVWLELMKEADANSDGMISYEEFSKMMKELLKKQLSEEVTRLRQEGRELQVHQGSVV